VELSDFAAVNGTSHFRGLVNGFMQSDAKGRAADGFGWAVPPKCNPVGQRLERLDNDVFDDEADHVAAWAAMAKRKFEQQTIR
jgi:hypothetical protein